MLEKIKIVNDNIKTFSCQINEKISLFISLVNISAYIFQIWINFMSTLTYQYSDFNYYFYI